MPQIWRRTSFSVIVVAIVVGAGVYGYIKNKTDKEKRLLETQITQLKVESEKPLLPPPIFYSKDSNEEAVSDWNLFDNSTVGYSFKYPKDSVIDGSKQTASDFALRSTVTIFPKRILNIPSTGPTDISGIPRFFEVGCYDKTDAPDYVLSDAGSMDTQDTILASGVKAIFGISSGGLNHYVYTVQNDKLICRMTKTLTDDSNFTKEEDNEAIGVINSFQFTK